MHFTQNLKKNLSSLFRFLCDTFKEALFPLQNAEKALTALIPIEAFALLPPSPACPIERASAVFAYKDERVRKLVWHVKYNKDAHAVSVGGYALFHALQSIKVAPNTIIVPMPITERRRRERGYNQCELLTDEIARLDTTNELTILTDLLIRTHHASRQTLKRRADRLESAKGIFSVNKVLIEKYRNAEIIVIDDVITTGSTMKEAMKTLCTAGFQNVVGLALAH